METLKEIIVKQFIFSTLPSIATKIDFMVKNLLLLSIVAFAAILLIFFFVKQNQKDKKALIKKLNGDYQLPKVNEPEI